MSDHVYVIDPRAKVDHLGPANAEQRAEIRKSWRTWFWMERRADVRRGCSGSCSRSASSANSEVVLETFSEVLR